MSKRFTETGKWRDKWFVLLPPEFKLAWIFICDECDHAGIIEIVEPLANMQIGVTVDWARFVEVCGHRIERLDDSKFWLKAFCEFQYGDLNPENRVHKSVLRRLESYRIKPLRSPLEGPSNGAMDKDKDKDKDKDNLNKKERPKKELGEWQIPNRLDTPEVRCLLAEFEAMRIKKRKPIESREGASKVLKHFDDVEHLIYALETCIANEYQGLKPDYRQASNGARASLPIQPRKRNYNL